VKAYACLSEQESFPLAICRSTGAHLWAKSKKCKRERCRVKNAHPDIFTHPELAKRREQQIQLRQTRRDHRGDLMFGNSAKFCKSSPHLLSRNAVNLNLSNESYGPEGLKQLTDSRTSAAYLDANVFKDERFWLIYFNQINDPTQTLLVLVSLGQFHTPISECYRSLEHDITESTAGRIKREHTP